MTAYTVIQALTTMFRKQFQLLRVRFMKNHVVICGLGRKGFVLAQRFHKRWERVVIIDQDEDNSMLERCRVQGIIVLIGDAADPSMLRKARVHKAKHLISVCGNDRVNAEIAAHARELVGNRRGYTLSCHVHIVDPQLYNLFRQREIKMGRPDAFRLEYFNIFEIGARILLEEYPLLSKVAEDQGNRPHIIVVGVGNMVETLVVNAARNWHDRGTSEKSLRITLIDHEAEKQKQSICLRHPQLEKVSELLPIEMEIQTPEFQRAEFLFGHHKSCTVTTIYVCLNDESLALTTALKLHTHVRTLKIPIVVLMTNDSRLRTLLRGREKSKGFTNLHAFRLLDRTCTPELVLRGTYEILARAIHEDYVHNEKKKGGTPDTNPSVVPWDKLPEYLKESNRHQAEHVGVKLESIGCDITLLQDWDAPSFKFSSEEVEMLAEMEHERFIRDRLNWGWKWGSVKNLGKKKSPILIPWAELSEVEKDKDRNTVRSLPTILARAGFQIYRRKGNDERPSAKKIADIQ